MCVFLSVCLSISLSLSVAQRTPTPQQQSPTRRRVRLLLSIFVVYFLCVCLSLVVVCLLVFDSHLVVVTGKCLSNLCVFLIDVLCLPVLIAKMSRRTHPFCPKKRSRKAKLSWQRQDKTSILCDSDAETQLLHVSQSDDNVSRIFELVNDPHVSTHDAAAESSHSHRQCDVFQKADDFTAGNLRRIICPGKQMNWMHRVSEISVGGTAVVTHVSSPMLMRALPTASSSFFPITLTYSRGTPMTHGLGASNLWANRDIVTNRVSDKR